MHLGGGAFGQGGDPGGFHRDYAVDILQHAIDQQKRLAQHHKF